MPPNGRLNGWVRLLGLVGVGAWEWTSQSSTRITCSTRCSRQAGNSASAWLACARWNRCAWKNLLGWLGQRIFPYYTPIEAGLDRFVRMGKGDFVGREALEKQLAAGVPNRFVTLEIHGVTDADPLGNEPLFDGQGTMVGRATSGYYGHVLKKSLAIGYVKAPVRSCRDPAADRRMGERKAATVLVDSPYDPENRDLKA